MHQMSTLAQWKQGLKTKSWIFFVMVLLSLTIFSFIFVPIVNFITIDPLDAILNKFQDVQVRSAIYVSLTTASITTLIAILFCTPFSYLMARHNFRGKGFIESIIDAPILIPHSVSGLIVLSAFGASGIFRTFFNFPRDYFVGEIAGVVVAQLFVSAPFMLKLAREGFEAIDPKLEYIARTLGASPAKAFFTITLPLAWRAIFTGSLLTWARAISEFGAVLFIAYTPYSVPTLMYYRFNGWGLAASRPIAILFLFICLWVFLLLRFIKKSPLKKLVQT